MAKELALGIKDNVEDIAAAFKKMAVINPDRERRQAATLALPEPKPAEQETVTTIRTVDSQRNQAVYDGLLEKSILEKSRKKPRKELENQLSIFGSAA